MANQTCQGADARPLKSLLTIGARTFSSHAVKRYLHSIRFLSQALLLRRNLVRLVRSSFLEPLSLTDLRCGHELQAPSAPTSPLPDGIAARERERPLWPSDCEPDS